MPFTGQQSLSLLKAGGLTFVGNQKPAESENSTVDPAIEEPFLVEAKLGWRWAASDFEISVST